MTSQARSKLRISLATQVMIGLVLGLATGLFLGELAAPLKWVGNAFIRLLQITVIPYIVVALITGLGRLSYDEVKSLALGGGRILLLLWAIGVGLVLCLPLAYPDWPSRSLFRRSSIEPAAAPDFLLLYIPSNPFFSLANAIVPAVVVFSILIGLALIGVREKRYVIDPLSALAETLARVTGFVAKLAPLGVFALIASAAGTMSFEDLSRLQVYVVILALVVGILGFWLLPGLVSCVTPLRHGQVLRELRTPLITAFATGSSLVVLPLLAETCKRLVSEHMTPREKIEGEEETRSSVDVLIPTFYSFPTAGGVLALGFVLFAGWYIGTSVPIAQYPSIILAGLASLFGGTVLAIPFVLHLADLPGDLFSVFLSIDVIGSRLANLVGVMHYATIALIGAFTLQGTARLRLWPLLRVVSIGGLLIVAALIGVRAFYTHVVVVPYTRDDALRALRFLHPPQPAEVFKEAPAGSSGAAASPSRSYADIIDSGVLKVCYVPGNYPLSFFNSRGDLVGFDIEMAHRFAERLNLQLAFLPLDHLEESPQRLGSGYCDVVFNSVALGLERMGLAAETEPFTTATIAFLVPDDKREAFTTWQRVRQRGEIDVASTAFQSLPRDIRTRLPQAKIVRFSSLEDQIRYFESGGEGPEAFLDTAEEGAAWTVLYPRFAVVVPRPVLQIPVVYVVAKNNPLLLRAMNAWLRIETQTGGFEQLYEYWIEGRTDQVRPPRWSVIRDVLQWVD